MNESVLEIAFVIYIQRNITHLNHSDLKIKIKNNSKNNSRNNNNIRTNIGIFQEQQPVDCRCPSVAIAVAYQSHTVRKRELTIIPTDAFCCSFSSLDILSNLTLYFVTLYCALYDAINCLLIVTLNVLYNIYIRKINGDTSRGLFSSFSLIYRFLQLKIRQTEKEKEKN